MSLPLSSARTAAPRPVQSRPQLRLVEAGREQASRVPFIVVCATLLLAGLIGVLVLNTTVAQNSYQLSRLQEQSQGLADETLALQHDLDVVSSAGNLAASASKLGMGPVTAPMFLDPATGRIVGSPSKATAPAAPGGSFNVATGRAAAVAPNAVPPAKGTAAAGVSGLGLGGGLVPALAALAAN